MAGSPDAFAPRIDARAKASCRLAHGSLGVRRNHERKLPCSTCIVSRLEWAGRKLVLETGKIARQADGAVLATYGDTTVLATVVAAKAAESPASTSSRSPSTTRKRLFAAGKIPGGYFKREGRPTEKETLTSRLIDRPIRPLFRRRLPLRDPGHRHRAVARSRERSRHRRHGRRLGRADPLRRALHGPDRRRPRRPHQRRLRPQPADRRDDRIQARSGRRRHRRRRADGRIGGQRAVRGDHARRGDVRPQALPAGDRPDHQARRAVPPRSRATDRGAGQRGARAR